MIKPVSYILLVLVLPLATICVAQKVDISSNCRPKIFLEALTRVGVEVPVGYGLSALAAGSCENSRYYLTGGIKRYCRKKKSEYLIFEVVAFYKNVNTTVSDNLRVSDSSGNYKAGNSFEYDMYKQTFGVNFEIGENLTLTHKRIRFEWYAGAGFRVKTSRASISRDFQSNYLYHYNESFIEYFTSRQVNNALLPNISLGFRMSYLFKKRGRKKA